MFWCTAAVKRDFIVCTQRGGDDGGVPDFDHIKLVHSMAGAAVFIYLTDCLKRGKRHGVKQVIAAGPAGFQRPTGGHTAVTSHPEVQC